MAGKSIYDGECYGCRHLPGEEYCTGCAALEIKLKSPKEIKSNEIISKKDYSLGVDRFGDTIFAGETGVVMKAISNYYDKEIRLIKCSYRDTAIYRRFTECVAFNHKPQKLKTSSAKRFTKI